MILLTVPFPMPVPLSIGNMGRMDDAEAPVPVAYQGQEHPLQGLKLPFGHQLMENY